MNTSRTWIFILLLILPGIHISEIYAWVYPEHRQIAILAVQKLDPEKRAQLDLIWADARKGYENRLTETIIDPNQSIQPAALDWAAWPAIAGDHSCSAQNMLENVLESDWILDVADICARLKIDLADAKNRSELINALRDSDNKLQRADPEYATRAGSNNVHFLLARPETNTDVREYARACLMPGSELNAWGAYAWYHYSALIKAAQLKNTLLTPEDRSAIALSALADEAFALHFVEDVFASGHTAGTWGDASQRKGTHDYYNERGLEVVTWNGERMILMGDAYMRAEDAETAAVTASQSLEQFLEAASGQYDPEHKVNDQEDHTVPDAFNVCKTSYMPERMVSEKYVPSLADILLDTPVPGLANGLGELPRFRAELGMFAGVAPSMRASTLFGGFAPSQLKTGALGGIEASVRVGIGLDGVLNEAGDGLVFLEFGWRQDASSTNQYSESDKIVPAGAITSAIPGRSAYALRIRMPFWLLPFDLLYTAPVMLIASPQSFAKMAVVAGNGGLIPWQSGIATGIGRFQFVLGREVGVYFFGHETPRDVLLVPVEGRIANLVEYRSLQLDFPVLEYRPFRTFSIDQSSSLVVQFTGGIDIPHSETVIYPEGAVKTDLKSIWFIGTRIVFDWRYYFN